MEVGTLLVHIPSTFLASTSNYNKKRKKIHAVTADNK